MFSCAVAAIGCAPRAPREDAEVARLVRHSPDAWLTPVDRVEFRGEWSYFEGAARWMGQSAELALPNRRWSDMHLVLHAWVPAHDLGHSPAIVLSIDGSEIDRFDSDGGFDKEYVIPASKRGLQPMTVLSLSTSDALHVGGRTLGIALGWFIWEPNVKAP